MRRSQQNASQATGIEHLVRFKKELVLGRWFVVYIVPNVEFIRNAFLTQ